MDRQAIRGTLAALANDAQEMGTYGGMGLPDPLWTELVAILRERSTDAVAEAHADALLPLFAARVAAIEAEHDQAIEDWGRNDEQVLAELSAAMAELGEARGKLADAWDEGWGAGWGDVERDETSANPYRTGEGTPAVVCRHGNNSDDCGSCHWEGHGR